jgi:hypothetical protein
MEPFDIRFEDIAKKETRCIILPEESKYKLPRGEYFFVESYCNDPDCDCRRVFLNVVHNNDIIATIGFGWEPLSHYNGWMDKEHAKDLKGPVLQTEGTNTKYAKEVLKLFKDFLLEDDIYIKRLKQHYEMFKEHINENDDADETDLKDEFSAEDMKIFSLLDEARYHRNATCNDKKAIKICEKILEIDENNRDAMLIKAGALGQIGKNKASLELIEQIIKIWPEHWEAYYLKGLRLFNKNERKAMQLFKKSLEKEERFDNLVSAAQLAYFMGKNNYEDYLDKAKELDPERFESFMKTCWTYDLN